MCGDSHTSTHGAFGALAFGIGASEVSHVLATQALWQKRPRTLRVTVSGRLGAHVAAKDLILALIAQVGAAGATGHVLEYAGPAVEALSMEARMTLCNMSIEAGGRAGLVAPDDTTFAWLHGRPLRAPWRTVGTRRWPPGAPCRPTPARPSTGTWRWTAPPWRPPPPGASSPETALPIDGAVPDPAGETDPVRRDTVAEMLRYMDLQPGTRLDGLPIDQVFIGSCTNGPPAGPGGRGRRAARPPRRGAGPGRARQHAREAGRGGDGPGPGVPRRRAGVGGGGLAACAWA